MSAPTQALPSWYSISTTILTDTAGVPTATSESLLYLPLTYYGPSIPLGSLWTYGGLTSPASTSSTSPTVTSTSAIPTTSSTSSTSFSSPSSSLTPTSTLPTSSPSGTALGSSGLNKNQLIGVIVGSVIGLIFLFVLILLIYIFYQNRRRNQDPRFSMVTPIEEDYYIVGTGEESPGEGSPRSSGEMEDTFLRRDRRSSAPGPQNLSNVPPAASVNGNANGNSQTQSSQNNSLASSGTSGSGGSGYGNPLPSSLGVQRWGNILSREELRRLDEEPEHDQDDTLVHSEHNFGPQGKYSDDTEVLPLMPPPRLVDPDRSRSRLSHHPSFGSQISGDPTEATVHTARRVKAEDLAPRSPPQGSTLPLESPPAAGPSVWKGLGGLAAGLGRLSWFQSSTSSSRRNSATTWYSTALGDSDIEQARNLLHDEQNLSPPPQMTELRRPAAGLGLTAAGERPISSVSAKSGSTVYYDAHSAPGTPHGSTPLPTPPPRALSNSASAEMGYWPRPPQTPPVPPVPTADNSASSRGTGPYPSSGTTAQGSHYPQQYDSMTLSSTAEGPSYGPGDSGVDILDMPAPRGISPFASTTSLKETKDTVTLDSSLGSQRKAALAYPPGLEMKTPTVWHDTQGSTPSPGSFAAGSMSGSIPDLSRHRLSAGDAAISIDVLEEAPPVAAERWRNLSASSGGSSGPLHTGERRTTFGLPQFVHQPYPDLASEIGSLHSMRSHLSPVSSRSTGSVVASRREQSGSTGSNSSRPSAGRSARSIMSSNEGHSLSHSGSISSDGRKKKKAGTLSPALSAFGQNGRSPSGTPAGSPPMSAIHGQFPASISESAEDARVQIQPLSGVSIDGSESSRVGRSLSPQRSQSDRATSLSPIPWAGGLEDSWTPS